MHWWSKRRIAIFQIHNLRVMAVPHEPRARRSIRLDNHETSYDDLYKLYMKNETSPERQERSNIFKDRKSSSDDSSDYDKEKIKDTEKTQNEKVLFSQQQSHSRTVSPEKKLLTPKKKILLKVESRSRKSSLSTNKQDSFYWLFVSIFNSMSYYPFIIAMVLILICMLCLSTSEKQHIQCIDNPDLLLFKSIQKVRTKFYAQKSDIWNDISSAINEIISRTPKVPSIILLYANETNTMNCLAAEIADVSSTILHTNDPIRLNPEDFGDDAGEIINEMNEKLPTKKVVVSTHAPDTNLVFLYRLVCTNYILIYCR